MRTVGIIFLSLTPFLFGIEYSRALKKRRDFISGFNEFIMFVRDQIRFSGRERDEIMTLALREPRFNSPIFQKIELSFKNGENLTKMLNDFNDIRLSVREIYEIDAFLSGLGRSDTQGQTEHCDYYLSVFGQMSKELDEAYSVKNKLSVGLSLSLSLVMLIIMI